jgi:hypothetical protein
MPKSGISASSALPIKKLNPGKKLPQHTISM